MKDKPSEWIAISDLMAGVMAVVMLLLVLAVLQKGTSELRYQEELIKSKLSKEDPVIKVTRALGEIINNHSAAGLIALDQKNNRLTLREGIFECGSACLTPDAHIAMESIREKLVHFLVDNPRTRILIEGYTDNLPVKNPVTDHRRFCAVYDDNFTLSAARAREARSALIGELDEETAYRIVVAGYGESRPLPGLDRSDSRNRRVEVQLLID